MVMGGATATSTVMVKITANSAKFRQEMTAMGRSLQMAGGQVSKFGTSLSASFASLAMMPAVITTAFGARFIKNTMTVFTEFNDSITRTAGILGEVSSKTEDTSVSFKNLEADIRRIGRTTRFTAVQAAGAAQALAIAGIAADEMVKDNTIEAMVNFAIAGGIDIQTAVNIGIAAVKAFMLPLSDLGRVSDVLTMTFTKSNTTIVGVGESMKFAAPVMRAAGVSIEETAAAIGALGNAGIRGTIAGTGLRMAINKLLKPTFDARRAMQSLNMDIFVLSAAGEQASAMLQKVDDQLERTQYAAAALKIEVSDLNDALNELSISQAKNTLKVSQIRLRARKEQRELTKEELDDIEKLELANDALNITASKRRIELMATDRQYQKTRRSELSLRKESNELEKVVELQTTGISSLADMLHTLSEAGATTAQVLEIFGVRGGTAMSALLSQVGTFDTLKQLAIDSEGRTKQLTDTLKSSAYNAVLIFKSAITDLQITMGQPFMEELVKTFEHWDQAIDENEPQITRLTVAMGGMQSMVEELARKFGTLSGVAMQGIIDAGPSIIATLDALATIAPPLARVFFGLVNVFGGLAMVFSGISEIIGNTISYWIHIIKALIKLLQGDFTGAFEEFGEAFKAIGRILGGFKKIVDGLARAIAPIIGLVTRFLGLQHAVGEDKKKQFDEAASYVAVGALTLGAGAAAGGAYAIGAGGYALAGPTMASGVVWGGGAATGTAIAGGATALGYYGGAVAGSGPTPVSDKEGWEYPSDIGRAGNFSAPPFGSGWLPGDLDFTPELGSGTATIWQNPELEEVIVPELAHGGIINHETLAILGEQGPEAIVPLPEYKTLVEGAIDNNTPANQRQFQHLDEVLRQFEGYGGIMRQMAHQLRGGLAKKREAMHQASLSAAKKREAAAVLDVNVVNIGDLARALTGLFSQSSSVKKTWDPMTDSRIPKLRAGGIAFASSPSLAVVGEHVSEAIVPLQQYTALIANSIYGAWNRSELVKTNEMLQKSTEIELTEYTFEETMAKLRADPFNAEPLWQMNRLIRELIVTGIWSQSPEAAGMIGPTVDKLPWTEFRKMITMLPIQNWEEAEQTGEDLHGDVLDFRRWIHQDWMTTPQPEDFAGDVLDFRRWIHQDWMTTPLPEEAPAEIDILDFRRYVTDIPGPETEPPVDLLDFRRFVTDLPGPAPPASLLDFREAVTRLGPTSSSSETVSVSIGDIVIGGGTGISPGEVRTAITKEIPRAIKEALRSNPRGAG